VRNLIAGPGEICICDECVEICNQILKVEKKPSGAKLKSSHRPYPLKRLPSPPRSRRSSTGTSSARSGPRRPSRSR
jgi:hypothetical protein